MGLLFCRSPSFFSHSDKLKKIRLFSSFDSFTNSFAVQIVSCTYRPCVCARHNVVLEWRNAIANRMRPANWWVRRDANADPGQTKIWSQNWKLLPRRDFHLTRIVGNVIRFAFFRPFPPLVPPIEHRRLQRIHNDAGAPTCSAHEFRNPFASNGGSSHLCQSNDNNYHIKNQFINVVASGAAGQGVISNRMPIAHAFSRKTLGDIWRRSKTW